jgi:LAO/AO transport system kinase
MTEPADTASSLAAALVAGDRRALAQAITLVESERAEDQVRAEALLSALPESGASLRLGVTGPPGAGKSTLIDVLGRQLIQRGERVAVLAIDPSSPVAGGSILGDKTRMGRLASDANSFIRPSPSRGAQGGVGTHTAEGVLLCEAAGYSVVMIETLGTGQGEHAVADLVDCVLLVLIAGAGDEIQRMKRGAIELADVIAVNKADGEQRAAAEQLASELGAALGLFARALGSAKPTVHSVSASEERGIAELWVAIEAAVASARASGAVDARRSARTRHAFASEVERAWQAELASADLVTERARLEAEVLAGRLTPRAAARQLVALARGTPR